MLSDQLEIRVQPKKASVTGGRVVTYSYDDMNRRYLTDSITPKKFAAYMKQVDDGDIAAMVELQEEMEGKDIHLQTEAMKRRNALTQLPWSIEAAEDEENQALADEAAALVRETIDAIKKTFKDSLKHLARAIGPNIAAVELVWEKGRLIDIQDINGARLQSIPQYGTDIKLVTDENVWPGEDMPEGKFVVHTPDAQAGFPMRVTLTRALGWIHCIKHFGLADWAAFAEKYGTPTTVAFRSAESTGGAAEALKVMLRDMTADSWAVVQDVDDIKMLDAGKGETPHPRLVEWCEKKQTLAFLGQTLTTDTQGVGSLALGKVHANVRADLTLADIDAEADTVEGKIFRYIVDFGFPRRNAPIPRFVRRVEEERDMDAGRLAMERLRLAREMGLQVDEAVKYEMLGIPQPAAQDKSTTDVVPDVERQEVEVTQ